VKVLVTGAVGFIGRKLCRELRERTWKGIHGFDVVELDKEKLTAGGAIQCDIRNEGSMKVAATLMEGVDACVHLAAIAAPRQAEADPSLAWETNVRGTQNVLALCRKMGVKKVVFASSAHVYGISPKYLPTDERHPLALLDTYTATKIMGEQLCHLYYENYGLSYTTCRLFNAYGPGQSPDYFIGVKLKQARAGGSVTIMNGDVTKDWVWVYDVVEALIQCLQTSYVGPLNIGTGTETSLREIADRIASAYDTVVVPDSSKDSGPTRMCADWSRAERVIGWKPTVHLAEGIRRMVSEDVPGV